MMNFEQVILEKIREDKKKDHLCDEHFHPSSAGFCERQMFLSKAGLRDFDDYARGSMMAGTIMHHWIEEHIKHLGQIEPEVKTTLNNTKVNPNKVFFQGNADFFCDGVVYDFKTTSNISYNSNQPEQFHVDQLLLYMKGLKAENGAIVYMDKRTLKTKQFDIAYSPIRILALFEKTNAVYQKFKEWKANPSIGIPFEKCGCFKCKSEVLRK